MIISWQDHLSFGGDTSANFNTVMTKTKLYILGRGWGGDLNLRINSIEFCRT